MDLSQYDVGLLTTFCFCRRSTATEDIQPTADNEYLTLNERCLSSDQLILSENETEIDLDVNSLLVQFSGGRMH